MNKIVKERCGWYSERTGECTLLCELQCENKDKCTFYETKNQIEERQRIHNTIMKNYEYRLKYIKDLKGWSKKRYEDEWKDFLKLSADEKEIYLESLIQITERKGKGKIGVIEK